MSTVHEEYSTLRETNKNNPVSPGPIQRRSTGCQAVELSLPLQDGAPTALCCAAHKSAHLHECAVGGEMIEVFIVLASSIERNVSGMPRMVNLCDAVGVPHGIVPEHRCRWYKVINRSSFIKGHTWKNAGDSPLSRTL